MFAAMLAQPGLRFSGARPPGYTPFPCSASGRPEIPSRLTGPPLLRGTALRSRIPRSERGQPVVDVPLPAKQTGWLNHWHERKVVDHFFKDVSSINSLGRPMRFQIASASMTYLIYAMIVRRALTKRPSGRCVIFVPRVSVARQVCRELKRHKLQVNMIGGGSSAADVHAAVQVCLSASAHRLLGHRFLVKLRDSSGILESGQAQHFIRHRISADMSGEFALQLSDGQADSSYPLAEAVQDGRARNLEPYLLLTEHKESWRSKLLQTLRAIQVAVLNLLCSTCFDQTRLKL